jgi:hypothetical protein
VTVSWLAGKLGVGEPPAPAHHGHPGGRARDRERLARSRREIPGIFVWQQYNNFSLSDYRPSFWQNYRWLLFDLGYYDWSGSAKFPDRSCTGARMGTGRRRLCGLVGCWLPAVATLQPATAAPSVAPPVISAAQPTSSQDQAENAGNDFVRPLNLFQVFYEYETAPGSGSQPGTISEVTTDTAKLRADRRIDFAPQWALGLRADLPYVGKNPISSSNPNGNYLYGVGDADIQAALLHEFDARWAAGFGARLIAPTGGDVLGSGKWQIMPGFAVRYGLSELGPNSYIEPLVRYDVSFAGDPSKKNISNLQFAPTVNFGLPDHWFVSLYPSADIRVNYGDPVTGQTGRLFLPFDVEIGRKLTKDMVLSLEVGVPIVKDYPVYDFKTIVRLNMLF